jgi:uncharacterized protein (DUF2062 family)
MGLFGKFFRNRFVNKILEAGDPPTRIARGVGVGSFVAVTPTVGFQIPLTLLVATLLRGNKLAAVAATFVLNPFIIVPPSYWYFPAYYIGAFLMRMDPVGFSRVTQAYHLKSSGFFSQAGELIGNLWSLGMDIYGPMLLGGALMGVPVALAMYKISYRIASRHGSRQPEGAAPSTGAKDGGIPPAPSGSEDET